MRSKLITFLAFVLVAVTMFGQVTFASIDATSLTPSNIHTRQITVTPPMPSIDLVEGVILKLSSISVPVIDLAFSADGQQIATLSGSPELTIQIWDVASGKLLQTLQNPSEWVPFNIVISPDEKLLIASGRNMGSDPSYQFMVWDVVTGTLLVKSEIIRVEITAIAISPDSKVLAAGISIRNDQNFTTTGAIYSWNVETFNKHETLVLETQGDVRDIKISSDSKYIIYALNGSKPPISLDQMVTPINLSQWSKTVADSYLKLYDRQTNLSKVIGVHNASIRALAISPSNNLVATASDDKSVKVWDIQNQAIQMGLTATYLESLDISPDGKILATGDISNGDIQLWDISTGKLLATQKGINEIFGADIRKVHFSPDGKLLASGSEDSLVHLWKIRRK